MAGVGASIVAVRRQRQVAVVLLPFLLLVEAASCFHLPPPSVSSRSAAPASALSLTPSSSSSLTSAGFPSQRSPATAGPVNKSPTTTFAACLRPPTATPRQRRSSSTTTTTTTSLGQSVEGDFDDPDALSRAQQEVAAGSFKARIRALYKFTRPHTIRGTILASIAGVVRALVDLTPGASLSQTNWSSLLPKAFVGMVALLLGNVFITGINQIYDRDIDQMNKPFLPVASGEMSERFAWVAVALSGIVGPLIVYAKFPPLLFRLYATGLLLGGIYSVPPIRTKRNPVLAGLTIAVVRGFLLNFGVYYAARDALGVPFAWSPKVAFIARFMTVFATIIAVTKDLPDVDGDKAYQIETFATKLGVAKIARGATFCLFANYVQAIITGGLSAASSATKASFNSIPMIGGHAALAAILVWRYRQLDPDSMPSVKTFYKHIWDLFYLEYVLYALI